MLLNELVKSFGENYTGDINITGISCDSRHCKKGNIFFACAGSETSGSKFIGAAIENGAAAIVCSAGEYENKNIPIIYVKQPRLALALAARKFYGAPPKFMVAITGTSGKTSVANFLYQIWQQCNIPAAMIGTIGIVSNGKHEKHGKTNLTTPGPIDLYATLAKLKQQDIENCVIEASSHGLEQQRLSGINFAGVGFTNLSQDHLDYHKTLENYKQAKLKLFALASEKTPAILFADNKCSGDFISRAKKCNLAVKTVGKNGDYIKIKTIRPSLQQQQATIIFSGKTIEIVVPLIGEFQLANALIAAALAISLGLKSDDVFASLANLQAVAGRLQFVGEKNGGSCFVDYAHKPDALQNILENLRPLTKKRIMLVFGCGGERDKGKRKLMGKIANKLADYIIVTDDNPRRENPAQIRSEILQACPGGKEIANRQQAITTAMAEIKQDDCLIVAGKGHETNQIIGNKILPFNDVKEIEKLL